MPGAAGADATLAIGFAFLVGLSFILGFAFEDVYQKEGVQRPGGVRTFPLLALIGGVLYLFDPAHLVPFTCGLLIVGAWLGVYYSNHIRERDEAGHLNVGLIVVSLNLYAFLLGGVALALPHWIAVGTTVAATLLFTAREQLHAWARRVEIKEIVTAAQFLILTGLVLPLLPDVPVTTLTSITPRDAWLALVVVCALSYASYLVQRYVAPAGGGLWTAALGGLYSSTATTVVLARQAKTQPATAGQARAGITLATGIMYLRILVVVAAFNLLLARSLLVPLVALSLLAFLIAAVQYRTTGDAPEADRQAAIANRNPLELGPAVIFAALFIAVSLLSNWAKARFGTAGLYSLAAVVGITDIDPFVLNLAQGGEHGLSSGVLGAAILVASSSNNVLKAAYAAAFGGWRASLPAIAALVALALAGLGGAVLLAAHRV
jgi:uncharacterized membrane protein (DUF4010 family)